MHKTCFKATSFKFYAMEINRALYTPELRKCLIVNSNFIVYLMIFRNYFDN